jgi:hypothetical protein
VSVCAVWEFILASVQKSLNNLVLSLVSSNGMSSFSSLFAGICDDDNRE